MSGKHRKNKKAHWLMAYICMPLIFALCAAVIMGYGLRPLANSALRQMNALFNSGDIYFSGDVEPVLSNNETAAVETEKEIYEEEKDVVEEPNIGDQYGQLVCERLGINSPVYFGDNKEVLNMGIGTYPVSWIPGCGRTTLMSAHNDIDFAPLTNVEIGDKFTLKTNYGTFEYVVSEFTVTDENDIEACRLEEEKEQVVLYTCYPFYRISGRRTERFFVYLEKISGPEIELINYFLKD